jgi:hypothetical protein
MWHDGARLRAFSSLTPGEEVAVEMIDGNLVEGIFRSLHGDCLVLDMGLYDRLLLTEEVERVGFVSRPLDP